MDRRHHPCLDSRYLPSGCREPDSSIVRAISLHRCTHSCVRRPLSCTDGPEGRRAAQKWVTFGHLGGPAGSRCGLRRPRACAHGVPDREVASPGTAPPAAVLRPADQLCDATSPHAALQPTKVDGNGDRCRARSCRVRGPLDVDVPFSREELGGRFLDLMAGLEPKGEGDSSLPEKWEEEGRWVCRPGRTNLWRSDVPPVGSLLRAAVLRTLTRFPARPGIAASRIP
jgi:hypothetical protein